MNAMTKNVLGACALALGIVGFAPSLHAAACTVLLSSTNPDGSVTNATDCGLATPTNSSETQTGNALNAANPGGLGLTWTHIDRDDAGNQSDGGFSFTGTSSGSWTISGSSAPYIITLKDGSPLSGDFLWFLVSGSTGTWQMYGTNGINPKDVSHMDLFAAGGDGKVPEPGILFLLGSALLGLGVLRRSTTRT